MTTYWENSCSFGLRYVSWYKYLIVSLVFSHLGFWSGNLFLIAPFPDLCLLVPFYDIETYCNVCGLKINVAKNKVLIFEKCIEPTLYDFYLYNEKLEIVTSFKYLGVYFF